MILYGLESLYPAYFKLSVNFAVQVKLKGLAKVSECIAGDVEMSTTGAPEDEKRNIIFALGKNLADENKLP